MPAPGISLSYPESPDEEATRESRVRRLLSIISDAARGAIRDPLGTLGGVARGVYEGTVGPIAGLASELTDLARATYTGEEPSETWAEIMPSLAEEIRKPENLIALGSFLLPFGGAVRKAGRYAVVKGGVPKRTVKSLAREATSMAKPKAFPPLGGPPPKLPTLVGTPHDPWFSAGPPGLLSYPIARRGVFPPEFPSPPGATVRSVVPMRRLPGAVIDVPTTAGRASTLGKIATGAAAGARAVGGSLRKYWPLWLGGGLALWEVLARMFGGSGAGKDGGTGEGGQTAETPTVSGADMVNLLARLAEEQKKKAGPSVQSLGNLVQDRPRVVLFGRDQAGKLYAMLDRVVPEIDPTSRIVPAERVAQVARHYPGEYGLRIPPGLVERLTSKAYPAVSATSVYPYPEGTLARGHAYLTPDERFWAAMPGGDQVNPKDMEAAYRAIVRDAKARGKIAPERLEIWREIAASQMGKRLLDLREAANIVNQTTQNLTGYIKGYSAGLTDSQKQDLREQYAPLKELGRAYLDAVARYGADSEEANKLRGEFDTQRDIISKIVSASKGRTTERRAKSSRAEEEEAADSIVDALLNE